MGNSCHAGNKRDEELAAGGNSKLLASAPDKAALDSGIYGQDIDQIDIPSGFPEAQPVAPEPVMKLSKRGSWIQDLFTVEPAEKAFLSVGEALNHFYREKLLPIERDTAFHHFHSPELPPAFFSARPMILTLGQYSTGKTSFIRHLIESDYPGQQIGPEPTTDRFITVCHGPGVQKIPGNALVYDDNFPFSPLSKFGNGFLNRLECARIPSPILEGVTFVDTPGVLSGEKQRLKRGYDFEEVIHWFIEHAAMIILFFDAHKLDISDEFKRCIAVVSGCQSKVQILLNKADRMTTQQLMRVHGALMWALGKVLGTPEVARVYVGSFWEEPVESHELASLFEAEKCDLYGLIEQLPRSSTVQKINDLSKRARFAKAHALLLEQLRISMPTVWGHADKQEELLKILPGVYREVTRTHGVPLGDFPDLEFMKHHLATQDFTRFTKLDPAKMEKLEVLLSKDIPGLLKLIPTDGMY
jgi:EH domain-containing protein 1